MEGFSYLTYIFPDPNVQKLVSGLAVGGAMALLGLGIGSRLRKPEEMQENIVPGRKAGLVATADFIFEIFVKHFDTILGKENREHVPFCASVFFFVFFANLLGLVPGMPAITTTVWVNVALAVVVFAYFNLCGVRANGLFGYIKHFCGPALMVAPLVFPAEILSACLRILTLNMRLYWNITADHILLSAFTNLVPYVVPIFFYALGTFVCFMQAFVFATLTMLYIRLAVEHAEVGHH